MTPGHPAAYLLALLSFLPAAAQESQPYARRNTYSVFAEYSNTSSHIILGVSQNRRVIAPGLAYSRLLLRGRYAVWSYAIEVRPFVFIQEPVTTLTSVTFNNSGPIITVPPQTGPVLRNCISGTYSAPGFTFTQLCSTRWSYAGGLSPLGQRVNFAPHNRLQPFVVVNAGFLASTHDIPSNDSDSFNFTFEFGGGIELFHDHLRSISAEYGIHHLSNAYRGFSNPGIDSQILKFTYSYGH
jgi:Lipid A 3-O-deacylase (PagL)